MAKISSLLFKYHGLHKDNLGGYRVVLISVVIAIGSERTMGRPGIVRVVFVMRGICYIGKFELDMHCIVRLRIASFPKSPNTNLKCTNTKL